MNIFWLFFFKEFGKGVFIGLIVRLAISILTRTDFTLRGLINSMLFTGFLYYAISFIIVWRFW